MTFNVSDLISALAFGLIVGVIVLAGFNSQLKGSGALAALQQRMGPLYNIAMLVGGGLPMVATGLLASSLRGEPTPLDVIILIVLITLAMLANFTLFGNAMRLLGERMSSDRQS
jgi:hypothetical protein